MYEQLIFDRDFHTVTLNAYITSILDMADRIMRAPLVVVEPVHEGTGRRSGGGARASVLRSRKV